MSRSVAVVALVLVCLSSHQLGGVHRSTQKERRIALAELADTVPHNQEGTDVNASQAWSPTQKLTHQG
jgi:hypothetical protein